jgi:hypothetical protein
MKYNTIEALYKSLEVAGRGRHCPRLGIFKILSTFNATAYNKPALLAKCHWRTTTSNGYEQGFTVTIQMESFKLNATQEQLKIFDTNLIDKEIMVDAAEVSKDRFILKWHFFDGRNAIDKLNDKLRSNQLGEFGFDDSTNGLELDADCELY